MLVRLAELKADPAVRIREKLDEETIQRYQETLDSLPPIMVFETKEGRLIADGFHRWAAAERLGRQKISAKIRQGSRNDALEYAITANTSHGKSLTRAEYQNAVRRLKQIHPDGWGDGRIAKAINRGEGFVRLVREADDVRRGVAVTSSLSDGQLAAIRSADRTLWPDLVQSAERRDWSTEEVRDVVRELKDKATPPKRKEALLKGKAEPLAEKTGEPAVRRETLARVAAEAKAESVGVMLHGALLHLANLKRFAPKEVIDRLNAHEVERLVTELPEYIQFQQQLLTIAKQRLEVFEGR